jgi:two-component system, cell cycle response regulator CpdR
MIRSEAGAVISRHTLPWVGGLGLAGPMLEADGEGIASGIAMTHVLVVDDELSSRTITARMLLDEGFQVHLAASAKEALHYAANHPEIRIAVVDVVMPEMNGVVLATRLPEVAPACRVILMTGYTPKEVGLGDLIDRFPILFKPFNQAELKAKVLAILRTGDF